MSAVLFLTLVLAADPIPNQSRVAGILRTLPGLSGDRFVFYDEKDMPRLYQDNGVVRNALLQITPNANVVFPWRETAGIGESPNAAVMKFAVLPRPVEYFFEGQRMRWRFPQGTKLGEVLFVVDGNRVSHPFEIRTRTKQDSEINGVWKMNLFRQWANPHDLALSIDKAMPAWETNGQVVRAMDALLNPFSTVSRLPNLNGGANTNDGANSRATLPVFNARAAIHDLPALPGQLVANLLDETPFKSVLDKEWITRSRDNAPGDDLGYAPSTKAAFHVVPQNYTGAFLETASKKCMLCHETAGTDASRFLPGIWKGRIRGDDGIFSFHPLDPNSRTPRPSPDLLRAGLLVKR